MGTHDSDEALVRRIQAGETRAFEILHRRYYPRIYKLALIKTGHVEDAQDIAGETFCRALDHLGAFRFQNCSSVYPWLHRIASNLVVDCCRLKSPSRSVSLDAESADGMRSFLDTLQDDSPSPQELVERKEVQAVVRAAIAELPADQGEAVVFRFLGEVSIRDIARSMNRTESAVKSLIHRGLVSLRRELSNSICAAGKVEQRTKAVDAARGTIKIHRRTP